MDYNEILEKQNAAVGTAAVGTLSMRNREVIPNLRAQRQELTARIQKIDQLLAILEKNPDFIKMLDLTRELM